FNPRARVGRDGVMLEEQYGLRVFQSTRPRGARHGNTTGVSISTTFQSTRPRGARLDGYNPSSARQSFQSTRPRGARPDIIKHLQVGSRVSIHAPAWGATRFGERF